jgi:hypothetical protein
MLESNAAYIMLVLLLHPIAPSTASIRCTWIPARVQPGDRHAYPAGGVVLFVVRPH